MDRQIAIHLEYQSRQESNTTLITRLNVALGQLTGIAVREQWSQRTLAAKIGIKESTLRLIKCGRADVRTWLPKLESAAARLDSTLNPQLSTLESGVAS